MIHTVERLIICQKTLKVMILVKSLHTPIVKYNILVGKEEVDHEHVSLLCSTQVDSPSVSLWYVL